MRCQRQEGLLQIDAQHELVAGSSEGGLLEYGSDDAIAENLTILREHSWRDPDIATIDVGAVGSVRPARQRGIGDEIGINRELSW